MPCLTIPPSGLSLSSSPKSVSNGGSDIFGLTLQDGVIEEMIKCVQNGKPIQLSLGEHPIISYGAKVQHLSISTDPFTHDLYKSTNNNSNPSDMAPKNNSGNGVAPSHIVHRGVLKRNLLGLVGLPQPAPRQMVAASSTPKTESKKATGDPALEALRKELATQDQKKQENTTKLIPQVLTPGRKGGVLPKPSNKSRILSRDINRSMPNSPALSGMGSPSLGPTSIPLSQQQAEKAKTVRKPVIHLLAVEPMSERALREAVPDVSNQELKNVLAKVAELNESTSKYEMRKNFWKELDVWSFDYDTPGERQRAIDNAVKQYDKMRMSASDPEWDRLLVKEERGTGKCLSKLQAQIATKSIAMGPKITVEQADASGRDTPSGRTEDELDNRKISKVKGEGMARSTSQGPQSKPKKASEKEQQAKRLFSKNPSKAATKAAPKSAPKSAPKPAVTKKQAPIKAVAANTKALSSEFVNESDEDDDAPPPPPKSKPVPKAIKRPREEEVDTSDSSIPLSKKVKKNNTVPPHRVSDTSQASHLTNSSHFSSTSNKTKNNSPQKSSPLASSPPTNASEFENSSGGRTSSSASPAHNTKSSRSPIHKRHQKSSSVTSSSSSGSTQRYLSTDVTDLARKFKSFYPKYEALHKDIMRMAAEGKRDVGKEGDLLDMHARLEGMKKNILKGIVNVNVNGSN